MAIRYSGDVEVRMRWNRRVVRVTVSDGQYVYHGEIRLSTTAPSSSDYDRIAARFLKSAERVARQKRRDFPFEKERDGRVRLRRVFQAPCGT